MNCSTCGGPMRLEEDKGYLVCDFCHNLHFPDPDDEGVRVLGEPASESCPVCKIPLVHAAMGDWRILYCSRCRGLLIAMGVFVGLIQHLRAHREGPAEVPPPSDRKNLERRIACPKCGRRMDTHLYNGPGNIILDDCSNCGLNWLDHGELWRIVRAPDSVFDNEDWTGGETISGIFNRR